jgi:hypothetical protein
MEVGFAGGSIFKKLFAVVPIWDESENAVPTCNKNIKQIKAASFLTDYPFSVLRNHNFVVIILSNYHYFVKYFYYAIEPVLNEI